MTEEGDDELAVCIQSDRQPSEAEIKWLNSQFNRVKSIRVAVFEMFPRTQAGMRKTDRATLKVRGFAAND
jgi:hypothetical protein